MHKELFNDKEKKVISPDRPLGAFSNFVVEQLPQLLQDFDEGEIDAYKLVYQAQQQVKQIDLQQLQIYMKESSDSKDGFGHYPFHHRLDLSALDLKMLETALVQLQLPVPKELTKLVDLSATATKQLPILTYEDLIYINPPADMRTFTQGAVGASESDFYHGHLLIEKSLERCINFVRAALFSLKQANHVKASEQLSVAIALFKATFQHLTEIGLKMDKSHFSAFRKYLTSHPTRELKGPSGAFTPSIPIMDMLVGGENIDHKYYKYLEENFSYYPRMGQREIAEACDIVSSGNTLNVLSERHGSLNVIAQVSELSDLIRQFRGIHYKGVKHQIPQAVAGTIQGTAGEDDPGTFLRERMRIRHT